MVDFSLKIYASLTFFNEVFNDTLCVERYVGPRLNCKYWTVESGCQT